MNATQLSEVVAGGLGQNGTVQPTTDASSAEEPTSFALTCFMTFLFIFLLVMAAMYSGLTVGLLPLDEQILDQLVAEKHREQATRKRQSPLNAKPAVIGASVGNGNHSPMNAVKTSMNAVRGHNRQKHRAAGGERDFLAHKVDSDEEDTETGTQGFQMEVENDGGAHSGETNEFPRSRIDSGNSQDAVDPPLDDDEVAARKSDIAAASLIKQYMSNHFRLLCTLLLGNTICLEALPIVADHLFYPFEWLAVGTCIVLVLFLGEVMPMALLTGPIQGPNGARRGRILLRSAPFIKVSHVFLAPLAIPLAGLLNKLIGHGGDHGGAHGHSPPADGSLNSQEKQRRDADVEMTSLGSPLGAHAGGTSRKNSSVEGSVLLSTQKLVQSGQLIFVAEDCVLTKPLLRSLARKLADARTACARTDQGAAHGEVGRYSICVVRRGDVGGASADVLTLLGSLCETDLLGASGDEIGDVLAEVHGERGGSSDGHLRWETCGTGETAPAAGPESLLRAEDVTGLGGPPDVSEWKLCDPQGSTLLGVHC